MNNMNSFNEFNSRDNIEVVEDRKFYLMNRDTPLLEFRVSDEGSLEEVKIMKKLVIYLHILKNLKVL